MKDKLKEDIFKIIRKYGFSSSDFDLAEEITEYIKEMELCGNQTDR